MATWPTSPTWSDVSGVNKGNEYAGGDGIYYSDLNIVVNNINYLYKDVASGGKLNQIYKWLNGQVTNVTYDTTDGTKVIQTTTVDYTDNANGSTKQHQFATTTYLPIFPGKYISMVVTSDNKKLEVKVDDTTLAQDYVKIDKMMTDSTPVFENGQINWKKATQLPAPDSIIWRNYVGDSSIHQLNLEYIAFKGGIDSIDFYTLFSNTQGSDYTIDKTPTDTGTLTAAQIAVLTAQYQAKNLRIIYDNQVYIRMDPLNHPDGTMNYIHLDSIQDGNGGYKATGKCFSVTVSASAWQVVDLDFGGQTTHNLRVTDNVSGSTVYFQLSTNRSTAYTTSDAAALIAAVKGKALPCTVQKKVDTTSTMHAGTIQADVFFFVSYGETLQTLSLTASQITITDNLS